MTAYIVTGTTRGIGRSLADEILDRGHRLFSLSSAADHSRKRWTNLQCDLSNSHEVIHAMEQVVQAAAKADSQALVLVNNAGTLSPMGPLDAATADQVVRHLQVNQAAPAILMSAFIRMSDGVAPQRRIINISSGAARHPYHGWAMYCASKAALDMFTRCVAMEQADRSQPVTVSALYPGKVDTGMQGQIRQSDAARFAAHADFVKAKEQGALLSPDVVARRIIALDQLGLMKNGGIYDLRSVKIDAEGRLTGLSQIVAPAPATPGPVS